MTTTAETVFVRFGHDQGGPYFQVLTEVETTEPELVREFPRLDWAAQFALNHNTALDEYRALVRQLDGERPAADHPATLKAVEFDVDTEEALYDEWCDMEAERHEVLS